MCALPGRATVDRVRAHAPWIANGRVFRGRRHDLVREPDAENSHVRFDERRLETEPWQGLRHRLRAKAAGNGYPPSAYRHRASRRLYRAFVARASRRRGGGAHGLNDAAGVVATTSKRREGVRPVNASGSASAAEGLVRNTRGRPAPKTAGPGAPGHPRIVAVDPGDDVADSRTPAWLHTRVDRTCGRAAPTSPHLPQRALLTLPSPVRRVRALQLTASTIFGVCRFQPASF